VIAKLSKGRGFRGALEYDLRESKGYLLHTNLSGRDAREMSAEFGQVRALRPNLKRAVVHVSISAALGESLSDDQWQQVGLRYIEAMGFSNSQFVITRHHDTEHQHIHVLANRIAMDGEVVSEANDYRRQEALMRELEQQFRLQPVHNSSDAPRKSPRKGEIEHSLRTSEASTRLQLQEIVDLATQGCTTFAELAERLNAAGVQLIPVTQKSGEKLAGLSFRLNDVVLKGSDLGKGYTPAGLQKRGIGYSKDRDLRALSPPLPSPSPAADTWSASELKEQHHERAYFTHFATPNRQPRARRARTQRLSRNRLQSLSECPVVCDRRTGSEHLLHLDAQRDRRVPFGLRRPDPAGVANANARSQESSRAPASTRVNPVEAAKPYQSHRAAATADSLPAFDPAAAARSTLRRSSIQDLSLEVERAQRELETTRRRIRALEHALSTSGVRDCKKRFDEAKDRLEKPQYSSETRDLRDKARGLQRRHDDLLKSHINPTIAVLQKWYARVFVEPRLLAAEQAAKRATAEDLKPWREQFRHAKWEGQQLVAVDSRNRQDLKQLRAEEGRLDQQIETIQAELKVRPPKQLEDIQHDLQNEEILQDHQSIYPRMKT